MERRMPVIAGESNIGLGRSNNEDNYCIVAQPWLPCRLAVVADGIGGHRDGDIASCFCCRSLMYDFMLRGRSMDAAAAAKFLTEGLAKVNERLFRRNAFDRRSDPMGCTVIGAVFTERELVFCGAGDSRLYEYDVASGTLTQLSKDDVGPDCCALCKAVGIRPWFSAEAFSRPFDAGKMYLLCSDGLHHFVGDGEIADTLAESTTSRMAVGKLMRRALLRGAGDNITVVVACPPEPAPPRDDCRSAF